MALLGWSMGKESEKNERWPPGKVEMVCWTSGCLIEVHVELHRSCQSFSSLQRECKNGDVQSVEARVGPSILVKIWVSMMSGWMAVIVVAAAPPWLKEVEAILNQSFFNNGYIIWNKEG